MKKPKTLLIKYDQNTNIRPIPEEAEEALQTFPSLGLGYLAAYLRKNGYPVEIIDAHAQKLFPFDFMKKVRSTGANIVGITTSTIGWPGTVEAADLITRALPEALIVVGGPHLTLFPEESLSFDNIDIGVIGDGEETLLEIVRKVENGGSLLDIKGTVVKSNGKAKMNPTRPWIENISSLPHPANDLLCMDQYNCLTVESPFYTMISSRGCSFKCGFCSQAYSGDRVRMRSPEDVVSEIENYVKNCGAKEIIMFDETFTIDEKRILEICRLIKEKRLNFRWNIRARVDTVTEPMLKALREAGCYGLHMGVESGSQQILDTMNKGITLEQIRKSFSMAKKLGFKTRGYFMLGYLGDDPDTYKQTVNLARNLDLEWASFSITTPLPGTKIFEEAAKRNLIDPDFWKKYTLLQIPHNIFPHIPSAHWDEKKLHDMMYNAYKRFYFRPGYAVHRATSVNSWKQFKDLFRGLGIVMTMKDPF